MRHNTPVTLAQLPNAPAAPPAGHANLYPATDGTLYRGMPDGTADPVAVRRTVRLDAHHVVAPGTSAMVPGLAVDVQPGLHEVRALLRTSAYDAGRVLSQWALTGPAASLVHATTHVTYTGGDSYHHGIAGYGPLTDTIRFWIGAASVALTRVDAVVDVTEPGTLGLIPTVERNRWAFDMTDGPSGWFSDGADTSYTEDPVHSGPAATLLTAWGDGNSHAAMYTNGTFSGGPYQASAWLYSPAGWTDAGIIVHWYAGSDYLGSEQSISSIPAGEWTQYTITSTSPEGANWAEMYVGMWQEPPQGTELVVDDVVLEQTTGQLQVSAGSLVTVSRL
ncbi:hypothetical protein [Nonomuraea bangladeshensis]|uniref:hypothetical protein n=1 Tax=Nonomuraea bangladeshensis TaxID=404385 RepID=UPI003C2B0FA4